MEALQKISESPLKDCPECESANLRKLVTAAAFRLKGTGWYETDFKGGGKGKKDSKNEGGEDKGKDKPKSSDGGAKSADTSSNAKSD